MKIPTFSLTAVSLLLSCVSAHIVRPDDALYRADPTPTKPLSPRWALPAATLGATTIAKDLTKRQDEEEEKSKARGDELWERTRQKGERLWTLLNNALNDPNARDASCFNLEDQYDARKPTRKGLVSEEIRPHVKSLGIQQTPDSDKEYFHYVVRWPKNQDPVAYFMNAFSPAFGVISANDNDRGPKDNPAPHNWSKIVWENWKQACKTENKSYDSLRWVIRNNVVNPLTKSLMILLGPDGARQTFLPPSEEFFVLLGSPNGNGAGWLLRDNKDALGRKTIKSITSEMADADIWVMTIEVEAAS